MTTLEATLDRLIHARSYRERFLAGLEAPELSREDAAALASFDGAILDALAERVARDVLARRHTGSGSLLDSFPGTIAAYRRDHPEDATLLELAYSFMDSPAFDDYRELPFTGLGSSLEEAFFRHAEDRGVGDPVVRENEFAAAMMKLLAVSPRAAVRLPASIRRSNGGYHSVTTRGTPTLYATAAGRLVIGPLTPFLADLLVPGADVARVAERHGVSRSVLSESVRRFSELGILEASR